MHHIQYKTETTWKEKVKQKHYFQPLISSSPHEPLRKLQFRHLPVGEGFQVGPRTAEVMKPGSSKACEGKLGRTQKNVLQKSTHLSSLNPYYTRLLLFKLPTLDIINSLKTSFKQGGDLQCQHLPKHTGMKAMEVITMFSLDQASRLLSCLFSRNHVLLLDQVCFTNERLQ